MLSLCAWSCAPAILKCLGSCLHQPTRSTMLDASRERQCHVRSLSRAMASEVLDVRAHIPSKMPFKKIKKDSEPSSFQKATERQCHRPHRRFKNGRARKRTESTTAAPKRARTCSRPAHLYAFLFLPSMSKKQHFKAVFAEDAVLQQHGFSREVGVPSSQPGSAQLLVDKLV
jgi:hypothetical protein